MIQKVAEVLETMAALKAEDVAAASVTTDFGALFQEEDLELRDVYRLRRGVRTSERDSTKFRKKLEGDPATELKAKKQQSERMGVAWWALNELELARRSRAS